MVRNMEGNKGKKAKREHIWVGEMGTVSKEKPGGDPFSYHLLHFWPHSLQSQLNKCRGWGRAGSWFLSSSESVNK